MVRLPCLYCTGVTSTGYWVGTFAKFSLRDQNLELIYRAARGWADWARQAENGVQEEPADDPTQGIRFVSLRHHIRVVLHQGGYKELSSILSEQ